MKSMRIAILAGAALAVVAGALPAIAQPGPGPGNGGRGFAMGEAFARADSNGDSRVSRDEGWAWLQARFQEVDADRDGGVTVEEMRAFAETQMGSRGRAGAADRRAGRGMERHGQGMFRALDANSDGKVNLEEIRPFAEAMFRARDVNSDGALTREEVRPRHRGPRHGQHHNRGAGERGAGERGAGERGPAERGNSPSAAPAN